MRRSDLEVTKTEEIIRIIDRCDSLSLALTDGDYPYVIEMNFGYRMSEERLTLYFHGAKQGKKLDLIRVNPRAAFSMSTAHEMVSAALPCSSTFRYESVCGRGQVRIVEGEERKEALSRIMRHYEPESVYSFEDKHANAVCVFALDVESFTGKRRMKK